MIDPPWRFDPFQMPTAVAWGGAYVVLKLTASADTNCSAQIAGANVAYAREENEPAESSRRWYVWVPRQQCVTDFDFTHWCDPPANTEPNYEPIYSAVGFSSFEAALDSIGKHWPDIETWPSFSYVYGNMISPISIFKAPDPSGPPLTESTAAQLAAALSANPHAVAAGHRCGEGDTLYYAQHAVGHKDYGGGTVYKGVFVIKVPSSQSLASFMLRLEGADEFDLTAHIFAPRSAYKINSADPDVPLNPNNDYVWQLASCTLSGGYTQFYVQRRPYQLSDPTGSQGRLLELWPKDRGYSVPNYRQTRKGPFLPFVPSWNPATGAPPLV